MTFGVCPKCNQPARTTWFKAYCDSCGLALKETAKMRALLAIYPVVGFLSITFIAQKGTADILAQDPESITSTLFYYYLRLALLVSGLGFIYDQMVRRFFATYE